MEIMRVSDSDFPIAVNVYRESWMESHRDVCTPEFLENRDYSGYLKRIQKDLFGIYDPDLVGVFSLAGDNFGNLYIHPDHCRKGYGTACVQYAMERSHKVCLTVLSSNSKAIGLYHKMGFRFTGDDIPLRNGLYEREMQYSRM